MDLLPNIRYSQVRDGLEGIGLPDRRLDEPGELVDSIGETSIGDVLEALGQVIVVSGQ